MKAILKASAMCALLVGSTLTYADEYADLRQSSANMTKEEAEQVEAGALPAVALAYPYATYGVAVATGFLATHGARLATPTPVMPALKKGYDSMRNRTYTSTTKLYRGRQYNANQ